MALPGFSLEIYDQQGSEAESGRLIEVSAFHSLLYLLRKEKIEKGEDLCETLWL